MKRVHLLWIIGIFQIALVFGYIYHQSRLVYWNFARQRLEEKKEEWVQQKKCLHSRIWTLKKQSDIKRYATEVVHMEPARINSLRRLDD